jgi:hypothetical protein
VLNMLDKMNASKQVIVVFGKIACLSSTFTYRDNLLERVSAEPKRKIRIYLDSGWPGDNYEATRSMRDRLIWKGYRPGS